MLVLLIFAQASALLIAAIFFVAGLSKLRPENTLFYKHAINNYALTPPRFSMMLVWVLGVYEIVAAGLILFPATNFIGLIMSIVLFTIYLIAFLKVIREGKANIDCGCSGPASKVMVSYTLVVRNLILIGVVFMALNFASPLPSNTWPMLFLSFAVLSLIYASAEQLIGNAQVIKNMRESSKT